MDYDVVMASHMDRIGPTVSGDRVRAPGIDDIVAGAKDDLVVSSAS